MAGTYVKNKNYIAILCCYEDRVPAFHAAEELAGNGYRIWQEEWLNRETEWTETAEQGFKDCRAAMVVLSNRAVLNHGFRQRLNVLIKEKKPFFLVYLENLTDLSVGMQLQLARAKEKDLLLQEYLKDGTNGEDIPKPWGYLIYRKNNVKIELKYEEMAVGRSEELCAVVIKTNSMIGRLHAKIMNRNGSYRVTDNNSLNGTYLNGHRLVQNEEYALQSGDLIRLANEEFIFYSKEEGE